MGKMMLENICGAYAVENICDGMQKLLSITTNSVDSGEIFYYQIEVFRRNPVKGLVMPEICYEHGSRRLIYDITDFSEKDISNVIDDICFDMTQVIDNILDISCKAEELLLFRKNILADSTKMLFDSDGYPALLYYPAENPPPEYSLNLFLKNIKEVETIQTCTVNKKNTELHNLHSICERGLNKKANRKANRKANKTGLIVFQLAAVLVSFGIYRALYMCGYNSLLRAIIGLAIYFALNIFYGVTHSTDVLKYEAAEEKNKQVTEETTENIAANTAARREATAAEIMEYDIYDINSAAEPETETLDQNIYGIPMLISSTDGSYINIKEPITYIGRNPKSVRMYIPDSAVNPVHAAIILQDGDICIVDKGSKNGTYIDGKRIPPERRIPLYGGEEIVFARASYRFQI